MILPLSLLAALLSALLWRGQARAAAFATVLMALFLASWPPVAWVAAWTLEGRYHSAMPPAEAPPEAIVVLSGYMRENAWGGLPTPGLDTYERLTYAVTLHRHWPSTPIVVTGGRLLGDDLPSVATVMAGYLVERGVPPALIVQETEARNTFENARLTAVQLEQRSLRSIALVTHASHMLRAQMAFRGQGLEVVPAPCYFATDFNEWKWRFLVPSWWSLKSMESTFHEWLGLSAYWVRGWI